MQGNMGIAAGARQMRRLFGSRRGAVRQDVLATTDVGVNSHEEGDFAAWVAYRKAKKKGVKGKAEEKLRYQI